jgi:kynureninase
MVLVQPDNKAGTISTEHILQVIDEHAFKTALVLLPGVQFYTGQYLNIPEITQHAHSKDIPIGWDCAHAAGNVDLRLHDWDVDFAVWCTYKYLNSGPGATAAIFVHEKHGRVNMKAQPPFRARLCGWWGADKDTRFQMENSETRLYLVRNEC